MNDNNIVFYMYALILTFFLLLLIFLGFMAYESNSCAASAHVINDVNSVVNCGRDSNVETKMINDRDYLVTCTCPVEK